METKSDLPFEGSMELAEGFGDPQKLLAARNWLASALRDAGAEAYSAGIGCGQADIDIKINGLSYNVSIRPK